ncbi:MAG: helix-turn-helix domain-containing protein [Rhizomicrobium sp.]
MAGFAQIRSGPESWSPNQSIPRHYHDRAYIAIVLSGSYEECGSCGRSRVGPGDALLHHAFDGHLDRFQHKGARILNLVVAGFEANFSIGHVDDVDAVARAAEGDPAETRMLLCNQLRETKRVPEDWPDILARDLLRNPDYRLDIWAEDHDLAVETVSRGFGKVFGVTPAAFRLEVRTRRALALMIGSDATLASIAATAGFADQAHMSRATRTLTGLPPGSWRRSNSFKTVEAKPISFGE